MDPDHDGAAGRPADDAASTLHPHGALRLGLLVTVAGLVLDQATKELALRVLADRVIDLPGPFHLHLVFNEGAAFGLPVPWWVFLIVTAVVLVMVVRNLPQSTSRLDPFAYGLLLAGALGNITDRLVRPDGRGFGRGEVVDFFGSTFFPTFNVADACITVGFVLLVLSAWLHERRQQADAPHPGP